MKLRNADRIQTLLAHMRAHPDRWVVTQDAAWATAVRAARDTMPLDAQAAVWEGSYDAAMDVARATPYVVFDASWDSAREAAQGACAALAAWRDSSLMLDLPVDVVRVFAGVGNPSAVLLLPAVLALNSA